jgi:aminoglycoside 6'-N-acetyltransferase
MQDPILRGERVTLRRLAEDDLDGLAEIIASPGVSEWWGPIESDGELAGWLGYEEVDDPNYMQAALDIVLAAPFQDRGLGPEALRLAIGWFVERGHHRFTIDPAADNERAIRAYRAVGFRDVGILRRYERGADGELHDNLLMELLAEDLRE